MRDCPLPAIELPAFAGLSSSWVAAIASHTELLRLDISGAPLLCDAAIAPLCRLPALRELNLSGLSLTNGAMVHVGRIATLEQLK